ncbi:retrovirus-related pol polyprotein from transposon TNT 1-94 [Tanacetum coccineum]
MQNPGDISNPTTAFNMALALMAKAFTLNDTTLTNNNQRSSSNPSSMQIAQPGMNMDQDRQMLMVEDNVGNQFRQNAMHNVGTVVLNASQNSGVQNVRNQNGLSVVSEIANQHGDGNVVTAPAEGNGNGINGNTIRCYNCQGEDHYASNCTVKPRKLDAAYLQKQMQIAQKEEAGIQLAFEEFDFMAATDGSAEVHHSKNCYNNDIFNMFTQEEQYTELLEPIPEPHQVQQNDSNVIYVVSNSSNLQTELDRTKERLENCIIKKENEYAKLWNDWYKKCEECKYDKISYDKAYNNMQQKIERLQAMGESKEGKKKLFDKVSEQVDTTKGTSTNTKFAKQSILGKPPSSSRPKLYAVTHLPNSTAFPKVGETNALSKPVTSNSVPSSRESTVVNNERVIAPGIFRINPFKATRVDNFVPTTGCQNWFDTLLILMLSEYKPERQEIRGDNGCDTDEFSEMVLLLKTISTRSSNKRKELRVHRYP